MNPISKERIKLKTKRTFLKQGTCSRTFFHIFNREFGHPKPLEENALDLMAGGVAQQGYQCGMLWGAVMGAGEEAFRRFENPSKAVAMSVIASQKIHESFVLRAKTPNCEEITRTDWSKKYSIPKFLLSGKMITCFRLAGKWAPEALEAAKNGLQDVPANLPENAVSCASEVIRKMGGTDEEATMVAGFAGGLGLSGNACGALSAAIWYNTLGRVRENSFTYAMTDSEVDRIMNGFFQETDYKMECSEICGRQFNSIDEHSSFINHGGCKNLIQKLAGYTYMGKE